MKDFEFPSDASTCVRQHPPASACIRLLPLSLVSSGEFGPFGIPENAPSASGCRAASACIRADAARFCQIGYPYHGPLCTKVYRVHKGMASPHPPPSALPPRGCRGCRRSRGSSGCRGFRGTSPSVPSLNSWESQDNSRHCRPASACKRKPACYDFGNPATAAPAESAPFRCARRVRHIPLHPPTSLV